MTTGWARQTALGIMIAAVSAAGCKSHQTTAPPTAVVVDNSNAPNMQKALQLAQEAEAAWKAGRDDRAIELYQQSLNQSQDLAFVWLNLGTLLMKKDNFLDAAEAFKSAADLSPTDARPFYNLGVVYQKTHWEPTALEYFIKALERQPNYLPALRGAVGTGQMLVLVDEDALKRARALLMIEADPVWRRLAETEQLRIENDLKARRAGG
jgi:tetratricopeptide (TPR) repeat protein